jgi:hypothetical protein
MTDRASLNFALPQDSDSIKASVGHGVKEKEALIVS